MARPREKLNRNVTALYARVSTLNQAEEGSSLGTQELACREYAISQGFAVSEAHVFREVYSGAELYDRPRLNALREAMRREEIGAVVCYAIDRLSRDPVHLGVILSEADHLGVAVHFVTEPLDDSMEGGLIRYVRGYAAKVEREKIKERTMRGKRARLLAGKPAGYGRDLYGYRRDHETDVWRIYEPEAVIVREIFALTADGLSARAVATTLNLREVPAPSHNKARRASDDAPRWGQSQIGRMLRHPTYKGEVVSWRWRYNGKHRNPSLRPESEWVHLPSGVVPPIVSAPLWDQVQARISANRGADTRNVERPALLRGHVVCAVCGRRMIPEVNRENRYYRCSSRQTFGGACGAKMIAAETVEKAVWGEVRAILTDPALLKRLLTSRQGEPDSALLIERDQVVREIARLTTQQARLVERFGQGAANFPWEIVEAQITRIQTDLAACHRRRDALDTKIATFKPSVLPDMTQLLAHAAHNLDRFTFDDKRLTLRVLGVRVVGSGKVWHVYLEPGA